MSNKFSCCLVGGGLVGKSAISQQYIREEFIDEYFPTIEDRYEKKFTIGERNITLELIDTPGADDWNSMREGLWSEVQGFLIVYSITDYVSFKEIEKIIEIIYRIQKVSSYPIVLVGNQSDLENQRKVEKKEGEKLANKYKIPFFEVSAKEKTNLNECFEKLALKMTEYKEPQETKKSSCVIL
eukprot:gene7708-12174_t